MRTAEWVTAAAAVWLIVSTTVFAAAVAPFVIPGDWLLRAAPVCEAKKRGGSCALCGMTTAYVAIGRADFLTASEANPGAVPFWGASVLNFHLAVAYVVIAVRRRRFGGNFLCRWSP